MRNGSTVIKWSETQNDENDGLAMSSASCKSRTKVAAGNCSMPRVPLGGLYPKSTRRSEPGMSAHGTQHSAVSSQELDSSFGLICTRPDALAHTDFGVTQESNRQAAALADLERLES